MTDLHSPQIPSHQAGEPAILYFGTPVILISSTNEDETFNLAPISSVFWLGWRCVLGLGPVSKTAENLRRTRECVINLPSADQADAVDRLALTTGADPVPPGKSVRGYRHQKEKFELARLTPTPSETVTPPRALECPVQLEGVVECSHGLAEDDKKVAGHAVAFEVRIQRVHLAKSILLNGDRNRVDPDLWRPLIMSFQKFYELAPQQVHPSRLAQIPESLYLSPDVNTARAVPTI